MTGAFTLQFEVSSTKAIARKDNFIGSVPLIFCCFFRNSGGIPGIAYFIPGDVCVPKLHVHPVR
jgi:hypothetical protein